MAGQMSHETQCVSMAAWYPSHRVGSTTILGIYLLPASQENVDAFIIWEDSPKLATLIMDRLSKADAEARQRAQRRETKS